MDKKEVDQYIAQSKELQAIFQQAHLHFQAAFKQWEDDPTAENSAAVSETSRQSEKAFNALIHLRDQFLPPEHAEAAK